MRAFTFILFLYFTNSITAQITIGSIESKPDTSVLRPPIYDSTLNFTVQDEMYMYEKFIGHQFYLPPAGFQYDEPFLFNANPVLYEYDTLSLGSHIHAMYYQTVTRKWHTFNYNKIYTYVYKPLVISSENESSTGDYANSPTVVLQNDSTIFNKYYTLIDVIYDQEFKSLKKEIYDNLLTVKNQVDSLLEVSQHDLYQHPLQISWNKSDKRYWVNYRETSSFGKEFEYSPMPIFVMVENHSKDTVYCTEPQNFILVPYFVKQKQIFEGKKMIHLGSSEYDDAETDKRINIADLSLWTCNEVTLLECNDDKYRLFYILSNNEGNTIALTKLKGYYSSAEFILESDYIRIQEEKKMKQEEYAAYLKEQEQIRKEKEDEARESHRKACIAKFGDYYGNLISEGRVVIGMTTIMCESSWGTPFSVNKITTADGVVEHWYYGFGASLHFKNGKLYRIEE